MAPAFVRRIWRKVALAYYTLCARDEMRRRHLVAPLGVWVCDMCRGTLLDKNAFRWHLLEVHAF